MAEITIQRTGELLRKLVDILLSHPEGMRAQDALASLQNSVRLTEYEKGEFPSGGGTRFEKIVRFATIDLVKAGWMVKDKGRWIVTEEGKRAYHQYKSPEQFYRTAQKLYWEWRRNQPERSTKVEEEVGEKKATITFEEAEEQARDAEEEARTQQSRQVTLINLERLFELWIEHIDKLEEARDLFPLKPIYFLAPER